MMQKTSFLNLYQALWLLLPLKRKIQFCLVMVLSVFAALSEMISIASVLPFVFILMGSDVTELTLLPIDFSFLFDFVNSEQVLFWFSGLFMTAVLLAGLVCRTAATAMFASAATVAIAAAAATATTVTRPGTELTNQLGIEKTINKVAVGAFQNDQCLIL